MAEIWFYHLERQPLVAVLPRIIAGVFARGDRISVQARSKPLLDELSRSLWAIEDTAFVPHGFAGEAHDSEQPIQLTMSGNSKALFQFFVEGALPENLVGLTRASIFFDGRDERAVETARALWKRYRGEGLSIKYWKQTDSGRWEDQAIKQAA